MKPFRERLNQVCKLTDITSKVVLEYETTPGNKRHSQLEAEYKDHLLMLRRNYMSMADAMLKKVEELRE